MCDAAAYVMKDGKEEVVLENVERVEVDGDEAKLISIFGDSKVLRARLKLFDSSQGRLVFEPLAAADAPP
jgi:predicted RNA-binding protein